MSNSCTQFRNYKKTVNIFTNLIQKRPLEDAKRKKLRKKAKNLQIENMGKFCT